MKNDLIIITAKSGHFNTNSFLFRESNCEDLDDFRLKRGMKLYAYLKKKRVKTDDRIKVVREMVPDSVSAKRLIEQYYDDIKAENLLPLEESILRGGEMSKRLHKRIADHRWELLDANQIIETGLGTNLELGAEERKLWKLKDVPVYGFPCLPFNETAANKGFLDALVNDVLQLEGLAKTPPDRICLVVHRGDLKYDKHKNVDDLCLSHDEITRWVIDCNPDLKDYLGRLKVYSFSHDAGMIIRWLDASPWPKNEERVEWVWEYLLSNLGKIETTKARELKKKLYHLKEEVLLRVHSRRLTHSTVLEHRLIDAQFSALDKLLDDTEGAQKVKVAKLKTGLKSLNHSDDVKLAREVEKLFNDCLTSIGGYLFSWNETARY